MARQQDTSDELTEINDEMTKTSRGIAKINDNLIKIIADFVRILSNVSENSCGRIKKTGVARGALAMSAEARTNLYNQTIQS